MRPPQTARDSQPRGLGSGRPGLESLPGTGPKPIRHREFSAPALQLLATAPSPVRLYLLVAICLVFATALLGSWFFHVDIYAVAPARIQPIGRSKVVQAVDGGRVRAVHIRNGMSVEEGELLVELDPTESAADHNANLLDVRVSKAEVNRREAAIAAASAYPIRISAIHFAEDADAPTRDREQGLLAADLAQLRANLESLERRIAETLEQKKGVGSTIAESKALVSILTKRVTMLQDLQAKGLETYASVLDAQEALARESTQLASREGTLATSDATVATLQSQRSELLAQFVAENTEARAVALRRIDEINQALLKSSAKLAHTRLTAPVAGTVQELAVTTLGQVMKPGEQAMIIVPRGAVLEAEALVANKDVGFIAEGQPATIKLDAFPYTRYGTLAGVIAAISRDALPVKEAFDAADPGAASLAGQPSASASTPAVQNLVYPVTIRLERASIRIDGRDVPLAAGMSASVELRTGSRRVIDYLLSPLMKVTGESAHER
jgi:hemolysin D